MSEFTCPECGAKAPRGTKPGAPYACPGCGNPTLPVARDASVEASGPAAPARPAWRIAVIACVVLGAAYFGVYELLTAEAKKERDRIFDKHGTAVTAFPDPGDPPTGVDAPALRDYLAAKERYEDRRTYDSRVSRIDTMFTALMLAFAAQAVFIGVLFAKNALRIRKASGSRSPRA